MCPFAERQNILIASFLGSGNISFLLCLRHLLLMTRSNVLKKFSRLQFILEFSDSLFIMTSRSKNGRFVKKKTGDKITKALATMSDAKKTKNQKTSWNSSIPDESSIGGLREIAKNFKWTSCGSSCVVLHCQVAISHLSCHLRKNKTNF